MKYYTEKISIAKCNTIVHFQNKANRSVETINPRATNHRIQKQKKGMPKLGDGPFRVPSKVQRMAILSPLAIISVIVSLGSG